MQRFARYLIYISPFVLIILPSLGIRINYIYFLILFYISIVNLFIKKNNIIKIDNKVIIEIIILLFFSLFSTFSLFWCVDPSFGYRHTLFPQLSGIILILFMLYYIENINQLSNLIFWYFLFFMFSLIIGTFEVLSGIHLFSPNSMMKNLINSYGHPFPLASFYNTNDFAQFLLLFIPFTSYFLLERKKTIKIIALSVFVLFLTLFIIINTESRLALIVLPLFFLLKIMLNKTNKLNKIFTLSFFIILLFVALITFTSNSVGYNSNVLKGQLDSINKNDVSISLRSSISYAAFQIAKDNFFCGSGAGSTIFLLNDYVKNSFYTYQLPVHNMILQFLAEYGFIVGGLFILLLVILGLKCYKLSKEIKNKRYKSLSVYCCSTIIFFPIITTLSSDASIQASTWFSLGLIICSLKILSKNKNSN